MNRDRLGIALLLIAAAFWLGGRGGVPIGRDISDDGLFVLVVEDQSRPEAITPAQGLVAGSLRLREAAIESGGQYRKQDARDDLSGTGVWQEIRQLVKNPPAIAIAKDGRVRVETIPESIETATGWIK